MFLKIRMMDLFKACLFGAPSILFKNYTFKHTEYVSQSTQSMTLALTFKGWTYSCSTEESIHVPISLELSKTSSSCPGFPGISMLSCYF